MDKEPPAVWVARSQDVFQKSRLTFHEVGVRMGYPADAAHRAVWRFLYSTPDPFMLDFVRFAKAVGVPVQKLLA